MKTLFNYKSLTLAVASASVAMTAHAAGMDRSGQDVTAFFQDGTYAEATYTYLSTDIQGKDTSGNAVPNITEDYDFFRYGVKADINDTFSIGIIYDEPFGAAVKHSGSHNFIAGSANDTIAALTADASTTFPTVAAAQTTLNTLREGLATYDRFVANGNNFLAQIAANAIMSQGGFSSIDEARAAAQRLGVAINTATTTGALQGEPTNVEIRTNNLTALLGAKFGTDHTFQIYGGPAAQRANGEVHLRGIAYNAMSGYDAKIKQDTSVGWVAGVSYAIPKIALRASLTYRSEIDHETQIHELVPTYTVGMAERETYRDFKITTPESWNLDFQTGVNPTTLLTAKVRYVPWSKAEIRTPSYNDFMVLAGYENGLPIASWSKDAWSAEIGLGKKVTDRLALATQVGYDSGAGNPTTSLGPVDGYWSFGVGGKYNITPEWSVSLGGRYMKFGDADAVLPNGDPAGRFESNDGWAAGLKLAYQSK